MKNIKKILKWSFILVISYFIITTLYFGYDDIDSKKGVYKFYWSGIRGLWQDRPFGIKINEIVETKFDGVDGPYIYGDINFFVDEKNTLNHKKISQNKTVEIQTISEQLPRFKVKIKDSIKIENDIYKMPNKIIAISDIEGNFNGFYSFLLANKVIDKDGNWIFNNGHLVLNGDFFDRGKQVSQVLWLIYHLENQAIHKGGKVHFLLGNHEVMNLYGDVSYNDFKYLQVAKRISQRNDWDKGLRYLYSEKSELGKWLRSKNIVEKIGNIIFVHAGLNTYHSNGKYSIKELNTISRNYYGIWPTEISIKNNRDRVVLNSIDSPFWDRRLNLDWKYKIAYKLNGVNAKATTQEELDRILKFYDAKAIVIGHSVVDDIKADYNNKVFKIDVKHGETFKSGKTKGIMIENESYYKIDDLGNKTSLRYK